MASSNSVLVFLLSLSYVLFLPCKGQGKRHGSTDFYGQGVFFDISFTLRCSRSYRHLEGIKPNPNPNPNPNIKLLEPAKYHFSNVSVPVQTAISYIRFWTFLPLSDVLDLADTLKGSNLTPSLTLKLVEDG